jgi:D-lactate dehydrogenase
MLRNDANRRYWGMNIAFFSAKPYDRRFFATANQEHGHAITYLEPRLSVATASLAREHAAICAFVNDSVSEEVLRLLHAGGTRLIALRSAGYNHVDLAAARRLGLTVTHVPRYSPHAVAEHTIALILALNRHIHRAHNRVREGNFSIDGLLGFDLHGKTAALIGVGQIGGCVARILHGFGCRVLAVDPEPLPDSLRELVTPCVLEQALAEADVISLHCPLTPATRHLIAADSIARVKPGVMLINTSRGGLIDTAAVIDGLLSGRIGYLGLDVYEDEADLFYEDRSNRLITDSVFSRLLTLPNVLITGHQAFFTREAVATIAATTLESVTAFAAKRTPPFTLAAPA